MDQRELFELIKGLEDVYLIKLGLADKMLIHKKANEAGVIWGDFFRWGISFLPYFGYQSSILEEEIKKSKQKESEEAYFLNHSSTQ